MAFCLFCNQSIDAFEDTGHAKGLLRDIAAAVGIAEKAVEGLTVCDICYCKHRSHSEFLVEAAVKLREKGVGIKPEYCERDAPEMKKLQRMVDAGYRNLLIEKPKSKKR